MGKLQSETEIHEIDADKSNSHKPDTTDAEIQWQPGYGKRFPYLGAAALVLVVLTAIGCALTLYFSNNKPSSQWSSWLRPNVAVSLLNALGNASLMTAVAEGISIAWWIKAVEGATVSQLHESWRCSTSFLGILQNLLRLDVIGFAVLAAKISLIDSVLYQRATSTYVGQDAPKLVPMLGAAATTFPSTGFVVAEGFSAQTQCNCFMIGDEYTPVVNTWQTSNGFFQGYNRYFQQCNGVCYTHIDAIGFEIECRQDSNKTDIAVAPIAAFDAANGANDSSAAWTNVPIFNSSFLMTYADGSRSNQTVINLNLQYFQSRDPFQPSGETCAGTVTTIQCELRPALIRYPITITNFTNPHVTNGVSLGGRVNQTSDTSDNSASNQNIQPYSYDAKQAEGFEVLSYLYPQETGKLNSISYLGGIANALHMTLTSSATITYQGQGAWSLSQIGILAQTMMYGPPNMGSCDCSFRDESLSTIVAAINQLTFLTSTGMIDQELLPFPATSDSSSSVSLLYPVSNPVLAVNSSTPLTIQGVASNSTTYLRSIDGTLQISDVNFYRTHFLYLGLGVGITLMCVATTISLYWRYGILGREVSMGPIEVAGAFGAPILSTYPSNPGGHKDSADAFENSTELSEKEHRPSPIPTSTVASHHPPSPTLHSPTSPVSFANMEHLLASVGNRKVVYGMVDIDDDEPQALHPEGARRSTALSNLDSSAGPMYSAPQKRRSQIMTFGDVSDGRVKHARKSLASPQIPPASPS